MIGQGRPPRTRRRSVLRAVVALAGLVASTIGTPVAVFADVPAAVSLRVRIEWGGGAARLWRGSLHVPGGTVAAPRLLGVEPDAPGSMYLDDGRLIVAPPSSRTYDGVDVDLALPADGKLTIELGDDAESRAVDVSVASLLSTTTHAVLDEAGNRISIRRAPGDSLRVDVRRPSLIFRTGESFEFDVRPHRLNLPPTTGLRLEAALVDARTKRSVWSDVADLDAPHDDEAWPPLPVSVRLPETEGVYDLVLELSQRRLTSRFSRAGPVVKRKVQLVVLSTQPPVRPDFDTAPEWPLLIEIDPTSPGWWDRLKTTTFPASLHRGPSGNGPIATRRHPSGPLAELAPGDGDEPAWHAYPLPVARPGLPHVVEIEYPGDVAQSFGVSLVEPNAVGAIAPPGVDGGVYVDESTVDASPARRTYRLVVWPRTTSPLLLVVNRRRDVPATYGRVRLLGPRGGALPVVSRGSPGSESLPQLHLPDARAEGRLLAAYFDRPLFAENFSAGPAADAEAADGPQAHDDWTTYYDGIRRLCDYLAWCGMNGALVAVAADGGAIYPSERLQPTPRYEDGVHFASAQDPIRKDVLELMLRLFDREGLRLVPLLDFNGTLPELEALQRGGDAEGLAPVGFVDGRWTSADAASEPGPRYNLLDPRVAAAQSGVVRELIERYGSHPSLSGVGVQLSATGSAQLPGVPRCLDATTLRRFAAARNVGLPTGLAAAALAERVIEEHGDAWSAWRNDVVSRHYEALQAAIESGDRPLRLYLASTHGWERPDLKRRLQPTLPATESAVPALVEFGIDVPRLTRQRGITWLRPYRAGPLDDLATRGAALELNRSRLLDDLGASQPRPGSISFHEPQPARLTSFDRQSSVQPSHLQLASQPVPAEGLRRTLARQLADLDATSMFHGGWMLPLGAEADLRRFAAVVRSLPAEKFAELPVANAPVRIRHTTRDDRTYVYVVNPAAWPTTVTFDVDARDAAWRTFGGATSAVTLTTIEGRRRWQATLEPFDVVGGCFLQPDVRLAEPVATGGAEFAPTLQARIQRLWSRAAALQRGEGRSGPTNADFELAGSGRSAPPAHWRPGPGTAARLVADGPHSGRQCALVIAPQGGGSLVSEPLHLGAGGRLTVGVWLRSAGAARPAMRLAIEGRRQGRPYYRFAGIGGGTGSDAPSTAWRQFVFQIDDLPTQGLADVRVRLEWLEAGSVFVDDVTVVDVEFSAAERLALSKTITLAEYRLQRGERHECAEVLDGYWPRFLMRYVADDEREPDAAALHAPAAAPKPSEPAKPDAATGMRERLRRALPSLLR